MRGARAAGENLGLIRPAGPRAAPFRRAALTPTGEYDLQTDAHTPRLQHSSDASDARREPDAHGESRARADRISYALTTPHLLENVATPPKITYAKMAFVSRDCGSSSNARRQCGLSHEQTHINGNVSDRRELQPASSSSGEQRHGYLVCLAQRLVRARSAP